MHDDDLESMFRSSLSRHADDVTDPGGRAEAAYAGVRRRRRLQTVGVGIAAVVVLAPVAVVAAVNQSDPTTTAAVDHPSGWRAESYNGIQLRVPASWGWGATPERLAGDALGQCRDRAYPQATSFTDVRPPRGGVAAVPYVGRPLPSGRGCDEAPWAKAPHVWFDSPLPFELGPRGGVTVRVRGATTFRVTVYDPNPARQLAILKTIRRVSTDANGCTIRPRLVEFGQSPLDPDSVTSISVCVYYVRDNAPFGDRTGANPPYLFYSTEVSGGAPDVVRAINLGGPGSGVDTDDLCMGRAPQWVDLVAHAGSSTYTYTINPSDCPGHNFGYHGQPEFHLITQSSVATWAINGTALYSKGGGDGNRLSRFLPAS